jgi:thiol-disulfide isomerase/thioredoxin
VKVGQAAPEISLPDPNGTVVNLSSLKGKVVLIDFWASWCGPCRASMPGVIKLFNKYRGKGFEVLGVSIDSKKLAWTKAIEHDKINFMQVNDSGGWDSKTAINYGINEIPTSILVDQTGKIIAIDETGRALENKIRKLLK